MIFWLQFAPKPGDRRATPRYRRWKVEALKLLVKPGDLATLIVYTSWVSNTKFRLYRYT